jgi:hypothetical protein
MENERVKALVARYADVDGSPSQAELKEAVRQYREIKKDSFLRQAFVKSVPHGVPKTNIKIYI